MNAIPERTISWLLEEDNPPVRYLTLKHLLPETDSHVLQKARDAVNTYKPAVEILKHKAVFWEKDAFYYRKYTGGYWQLIFLADFFLNEGDPVIEKGCRSVLRHPMWYDRFLLREPPALQCLSANMLRSLSHFGFGKEEKVREGYRLLAENIVQNGGIDCYVMDVSSLQKCYMAVPKLLRAFNRAPVQTETIKQATDTLIRQILEFHVYKYVPPFKEGWEIQPKERNGKNYKGKQDLPELKRRLYSQYTERPWNPKPGWVKFGFPMHYNSHILETMDALADAGVHYTAELNDPLNVIKDNAGKEMQWSMRFSLNGKMWTDIEKRGKPSKWITFYALKVLKHFEGITVT